MSSHSAVGLLQSFRSYFCELKGLREGLLFDELATTERAAAPVLLDAMVLHIAGRCLQFVQLSHYG